MRWAVALKGRKRDSILNKLKAISRQFLGELMWYRLGRETSGAIMSQRFGQSNWMKGNAVNSSELGAVGSTEQV